MPHAQPQPQMLRRRSAGFRGVTIAAPTPLEIPGYQEIARIAQREEKEALELRKPIAIGAMVATSIGVSVVLSADDKNYRAAGAFLAGAGITAGVGAIALHVRASNRREMKEGYARALASVGMPAPGVTIASEGK